MKEIYNLIDKKELLEMLSEAVKIKSINPPGKEVEMCQYIEGILIKNNIEYKKIKAEENRYNIIAKLNGETEKDAIVFSGHMDVVPVSEDELKRWSYEPFSAIIENGYLYGRGSTDMKGGLISALYAMIVLKRNNIIPPQDIIFAATVDEENYMKGSSALIGLEDFKYAKYLVICEPTGLKLCNRQKGRTWADVKVKGKTAHGSQKGTGENAIYLAIKLIEKIKNMDFKNYKESFWRVLSINAGVEPQVVPDSCIFTVDARLQVGHDPKNVWQKLDVIIEEMKKENKDFFAEYKIIDIRDSWQTELEEQIAQDIKKSLERLNIPFEPDTFLGSTDASKLMKNDLIPVIIGPGDLNKAHREDECINIEEFYNSCKLYLDIMNGL